MNTNNQRQLNNILVDDVRLNKDRWLIGYSDLITLLFAVFAVLYGMNIVTTSNEHEHDNNNLSRNEELHPLWREHVVDTDNNVKNNDNQIYGSLQQNLIQQFGKLMPQNVNLRMVNEWLEIEINNDFLFSSGSALLNEQAKYFIGELAVMVNNNVYRLYDITVEGFADNLPIKNNLYASNWELSCDRAVKVIRYLITKGVSADRLAAAGYGENFPLDGRNTAEGRAKNRRIVIVIGKDDARRKYLKKL